MKIIDLIMRFEMHSKNAREVAEKDISDYYVYNTLGNGMLSICEYSHRNR